VFDRSPLEENIMLQRHIPTTVATTAPPPMAVLGVGDHGGE
jgi:hypothetical protein